MVFKQASGGKIIWFVLSIVVNVYVIPAWLQIWTVLSVAKRCSNKPLAAKCFEVSVCQRGRGGWVQKTNVAILCHNCHNKTCKNKDWVLKATTIHYLFTCEWLWKYLPFLCQTLSIGNHSPVELGFWGFIFEKTSLSETNNINRFKLVQIGFFRNTDEFFVVPN